MEGPGQVFVQTSTGETLVPTFGFDKDGEVADRKYGEEVGYATLKKEWISKMVSMTAGNYKEEANKHIPIENRPYDYLYEAAKGDRKDFNYDYINTVYVLVFSRSDRPNEIGIIADREPIEVEDVKVTFKKEKIV